VGLYRAGASLASDLRSDLAHHWVLGQG